MKALSRFCPVFLSLAAAALLLPACSGVSPADRIRENPAMYQALPPAQQKAVERGQLEIGMSPEAVYLVMGAPSGKSESVNDKGVREEVWIYSGLVPVGTVPRIYYYDYPFGGPVCWDDWVYRRRVIGAVRFVDGRVASWERNMPGRY